MSELPPVLQSLRGHGPPFLMGIVNVTPDSFYDGGDYDSEPSAIQQARTLWENGADVIDVGGESTRPGADPVGPEEEKHRVVPVIEGIRRKFPEAVVSIDTSKASVARSALEAGADWINDVTALRGDPQLVEVAAEYDAGLVLMHMQGTPRTMQENPVYEDVVLEVKEFLEERVEHACDRGVNRSNIIVDPGIGFGKTLEHNRKLLSNVKRFSGIGCPVLVGHSRKSFLGEVLERPAECRLDGTLLMSWELFRQDVSMVRVHDVEPHADARRLYKWYRGA